MDASIYLTTDLADLKPYVTFETQHDMDDKIYAYIECLRIDEVPESVIDVLLFFGRSSLRVLGVSFAKYETIGQAIGKSKSIVIRAVRVLKDYGMIDVIPTLKKWGDYGTSRKKSVNVIRIMNAIRPNVTSQNDTAGAPDKPANDEQHEAFEASEPILHKHQKELLHNTSSQESSATASPYIRFKRLISDKALRNKIYGIWLAHTSYLRGIYDNSLLLQVGIRAIMSTFKAGDIRNRAGYYNGVLDRMLDRLYDDEIRMLTGNV